MSFASKVKIELAKVIPQARHCQIAELLGILCMLGYIKTGENHQLKLYISTEHEPIVIKYFTLLEKTYNIETSALESQGVPSGNRQSYKISLNDTEARRVLISTGLLRPNQNIEENKKGLEIQNMLVVASSCCKRAFLRGVFLASGSLSDPEKGYHFELITSSISKAEQIHSIMVSCGLDAKIIQRKKSYIVYLKGSEDIVEILGIMQAPKFLMELENIRIVKEIRNHVNRKINCEIANLNRSIDAALKQIDDIQYIDKVKGLDFLPEKLQELAQLRLEYNDISYKELGSMLKVPLGKSGVNHRLRKISKIADNLREQGTRV